jgi:hypothetical protein
MDTFKTQFMMSDVRTYVTVKQLEEQTYGCTLNLVDFFEGDEIPTDEEDFDLKIKHLPDGLWQQDGNAKVHMKPEDLQRLGKAIEDVNLDG